MIGGIFAIAIIGVISASLIFINSDTREASSGSPAPSPTNEPTPDLSASNDDAVAQVERAYLGFWDVWTEANLKLDPELMKQVATGKALRALTELLQEQRAKNQPVRISVEHRYETLLTGPETASVEDRYVNHSVRLDPKTMQPIEPDSAVQVRKSHTLTKVDGQWRVAEIIEYR